MILHQTPNFQIDQSQEPSDVQMRHTIYSLLAQEGTLKSQMVKISLNM